MMRSRSRVLIREWRPKRHRGCVVGCNTEKDDDDRGVVFISRRCGAPKHHGGVVRRGWRGRDGRVAELGPGETGQGALRFAG